MIDIPTSLAELLADPKRTRDALLLLKALSELNVQLVPPQGAVALVPGQKNIRGDPPNLLLALPIQFPNRWAAPTGTLSRVTFNADASTTAGAAYSQTQVQAINDRLLATRRLLAALITDLLATKLAPAAS